MSMFSYNSVNNDFIYKDKNSYNLDRGEEIPDSQFTTFSPMIELKRIKENIYKLSKNLPQIKNLHAYDISLDIQHENEEYQNAPMEQNNDEDSQQGNDQSEEQSDNEGGQEGIEPMDTSGEMDPNADNQGDDGSMDPSMGMDPNMGMDPSMGMGQDPNAIPKPTSSEEVGRIIELKKIMNRLVSIEAYLSSSFDPNLLKVRELVAQSLDLFQIMMANYSLYKDEIDERIISYYKFIEKVYIILQKYYKHYNAI